MISKEAKLEYLVRGLVNRRNDRNGVIAKEAAEAKASYSPREVIEAVALLNEVQSAALLKQASVLDKIAALAR